MKQFIIFIVAFVAVFAVSLKMYGANEDDNPIEPVYYCVYFEAHGRCYIGDGTACYGIDADCNWLN